MPQENFRRQQNRKNTNKIVEKRKRKKIILHENNMKYLDVFKSSIIELQ